MIKGALDDNNSEGIEIIITKTTDNIIPINISLINNLWIPNPIHSKGFLSKKITIQILVKIIAIKSIIFCSMFGNNKHKILLIIKNDNKKINIPKILTDSFLLPQNSVTKIKIIGL